jgi:Tol biopolymer transport system component
VEAREAKGTAARAPVGVEGTLSPVHYPGERHLGNVRQLTFGGENAEAYWSADGRQLIFQSTHPPFGCDQIFVLDVDDPEAEPRLVSTGDGRTTCAYFFPDGKRILYSSTHLGGKSCPRPPDLSQGYVWALYPDYDVFLSDADGTGLEQITFNPTFDGFPMFSPDGKRLVFCSNRHNAKPGDTNVFVADWVP